MPNTEDAHTALQDIDRRLTDMRNILFEYFQTVQDESLVQDEEQFDIIPEDSSVWIEQFETIYADSLTRMTWLANKQLAEYTTRDDTRHPYFDHWAKDGTQYVGLIRYQRREQ